MTLPPFQHLVDAHWWDVARLAHALAGPVDGDDVAQQAWTQALAAYPRLRSAANLRGWLLTVTARCATDVHRARARRPVPVADVPERADAAPPVGDRLPDGELWTAVRDLPQRQRTALALRYVADLDHAAVAAALGTTPAATRRLVSARGAARPPRPDPHRTDPHPTDPHRGGVPMTEPLEGPLELALRGFRPDVRPPLLSGGDVRYAVDDTRLGRMLFAVRPDGTLLATRYVPDDAAHDALLARLAGAVSPRVLRAPGAVDAVRRQLDEYLDGRRRRFELAVDPVLASPFQRTVLDRLAGVRYGTTTSYGALAAALGRPGASRAVGAALGANPLCVVLPCHRVVATSGAPSGYAGGVAVKRLLLDLEARTGS